MAAGHDLEASKAKALWDFGRTCCLFPPIPCCREQIGVGCLCETLTSCSCELQGSQGCQPARYSPQDGRRHVSAEPTTPGTYTSICSMAAQPMLAGLNLQTTQGLLILDHASIASSPRQVCMPATAHDD